MRPHVTFCPHTFSLPTRCSKKLTQVGVESRTTNFASQTIYQLNFRGYSYFLLTEVFHRISGRNLYENDQNILAMELLHYSCNFHLMQPIMNWLRPAPSSLSSIQFWSKMKLYCWQIIIKGQYENMTSNVPKSRYSLFDQICQMSLSSLSDSEFWQKNLWIEC